MMKRSAAGGGPQLGEPAQALDRQHDGHALRPARPAGCAAIATRSSTPIHAPPRSTSGSRTPPRRRRGAGRVGRGEHGGRHRPAAQARGEHGHHRRRPRPRRRRPGPRRPGQHRGDGEQPGEAPRAPSGRAARAPARPSSTTSRRAAATSASSDEGGDAHRRPASARRSSRASTGCRSRSASHRPAASRWPTACRLIPSSAGGLGLGAPGRDQVDRLPRLRAAPLRPARSARWPRPGRRRPPRRRTPADGDPGRPLLGGVDRPAGAAGRPDRSPPGCESGQRGLHRPGPDADAPAPVPGPAGPARRRPRSGSARTPWNSSPAVRSNPQHHRHVASSDASTSATRSAPRRLPRWSTVSTNGTPQV